MKLSYHNLKMCGQHVSPCPEHPPSRMKNVRDIAGIVAAQRNTVRTDKSKRITPAALRVDV
jgi:hypothetical protein